MKYTGFEVEVLADSISRAGARLTTLRATYPRLIHAELLTHRDKSRNSASSRAIPVGKMLERIATRPAFPIHWGANEAGMSASGEIAPDLQIEAKRVWADACYNALDSSQALMRLGVHKQIANRLTEPFQYMTVILSATEWANFFWLRCAPDVQPEFQHLARLACDAYYASEPRLVTPREWHLPLIYPEDRAEAAARGWTESELCWVSVGRCARVSYLTFEGKRDLDEDLKLARRLRNSGHWSPFEHVATPLPGASATSGNFRGWDQFRKQFADECRSTLAGAPTDYCRAVA